MLGVGLQLGRIFVEVEAGKSDIAWQALPASGLRFATLRVIEFFFDIARF